MTEDEIKEYINEMMYAYIDSESFDVTNLRKELAEELREYRDKNIYVGKRLEDIEHMIHQHAIGVQNVYSEVQRIKDLYSLDNVDMELIDKIARIKEILD